MATAVHWVRAVYNSRDHLRGMVNVIQGQAKSRLTIDYLAQFDLPKQSLLILSQSEMFYGEFNCSF